MQNVETILKNVIDELNTQLDGDNKLTYEPTTLLKADDSKLDSLTLFAFIGILEDEVEDNGASIDFMDILMSGDEDKVLYNVESLENFLNQY